MDAQVSTTTASATAVARASSGETVVTTATATPQPPPAEPVEAVPPDAAARDAAVQEVIQKLQDERIRINSTVEACGVESHKPGGIAPLPEGEVAAGKSIDLADGPHGDVRTKCRMATLPTLMKVRALVIPPHTVIIVSSENVT